MQTACCWWQHRFYHDRIFTIWFALHHVLLKINIHFKCLSQLAPFADFLFTTSDAIQGTETLCSNPGGCTFWNAHSVYRLWTFLLWKPDTIFFLSVCSFLPVGQRKKGWQEDRCSRQFHRGKHPIIATLLHHTHSNVKRPLLCTLFWLDSGLPYSLPWLGGAKCLKNFHLQQASSTSSSSHTTTFNTEFDICFLGTCRDLWWKLDEHKGTAAVGGQWAGRISPLQLQCPSLNRNQHHHMVLPASFLLCLRYCGLTGSETCGICINDVLIMTIFKSTPLCSVCYCQLPTCLWDRAQGLRCKIPILAMFADCQLSPNPWVPTFETQVAGGLKLRFRISNLVTTNKTSLHTHSQGLGVWHVGFPVWSARLMTVF